MNNTVSLNHEAVKTLIHTVTLNNPCVLKKSVRLSSVSNTYIQIKGVLSKTVILNLCVVAPWGDVK